MSGSSHIFFFTFLKNSMPELFLFFLIKKLACVDCNSDMTQNREEKEVKMLLYPWAEMYSSQYGRDTYFTGYAHRNLNCTAACVLNATSTEYIKWLPEKQGMFHSCVTSLVNWKTALSQWSFWQHLNPQSPT